MLGTTELCSLLKSTKDEFIDSIVKCGKKYSYGLEVGSKPEFLAAMAYDLAEDALFLCNGFKDADFIKLGFSAKALGKNVVLIIEGPDELEHILNQAKQDPTNCPDIGIRSNYIVEDRENGQNHRANPQSLV